jgi:hypothetical protein
VAFGDKVPTLLVICTEIAKPIRLTLSFLCVLIFSCQLNRWQRLLAQVSESKHRHNQQYYPEETMVEVWFSGLPSDIRPQLVWPWVKTLGHQKYSPFTLSRVSGSPLARYPGFANRPSGKERIKRQTFTKFKSQIYKKAAVKRAERR